MRRSALAAVLLLANACAAPLPRAESTTSAVPSPSASLSPTPSPSPSPSRVETGSFLSATLQRVMPYGVYVPRGYDSEPAKRYPVVYLLHGLSGAYDEWIVYGVPQAADELIAAGEIPSLLIVFPQGDQAYWVDHANGGPRWGQYTARDVVREIDARYRTVADRRRRAVGGLSMGADGALQLSLNFPEAFGAAGAHSPALRRFGDAPPFFGNEAQYAQRDPWSLALARPQVARSIALWIDVGEADPLHVRIAQFHEALTKADIPHAWREYAGAHTADYWSEHARDYLRFYGAALCLEQRGVPSCAFAPR